MINHNFFLNCLTSGSNFSYSLLLLIGLFYYIKPNAKETTQSVQSYTWTDWVVSFAFGFICNDRDNPTF